MTQRLQPHGTQPAQTNQSSNNEALPTFWSNSEENLRQLLEMKDFFVEKPGFCQLLTFLEPRAGRSLQK